MCKVYRFIVVFILALLTFSAMAPAGYADESEDKAQFAGMKRRTVPRLKYIDTKELMDTLQIKPGMTILDIGTGTGYYAYKFAEAVKGTGEVFATDINKVAVQVMDEEIRKKGITNLYPVLVQSDGVDEVYGEHKYDLIFLSYVYYNLENPVEYLREMRAFLTENGRVAVLLFKVCPSFSPDAFSNFEGFIKELSREPADSPFYKALNQSTRDLLKQQSKGKFDERLKDAVIDDFNRILFDIHFFDDFLENLLFKKEVSFSRGERDFANWLLMCLKEEGSFKKTQAELTAEEKRTLRQLNRLLVIQRFRRYFNQGAIPPPFFSVSDAHRQTSEFLVQRDLREAGYKLEDVHNLKPYHVMLIFTADK